MTRTWTKTYPTPAQAQTAADLPDLANTLHDAEVGQSAPWLLLPVPGTGEGLVDALKRPPIGDLRGPSPATGPHLMLDRGTPGRPAPLG
ncbi:hypothetical protein AB0H37_42660 [Actinomadura sp. NPDC023710]|uniref:hypothetical protein n=1 Tax=Actinomadura sp. NPDC023710 TaxID=3158219 RepID=UPI0033DCFBED